MGCKDQSRHECGTVEYRVQKGAGAFKTIDALREQGVFTSSLFTKIRYRIQFNKSAIKPGEYSINRCDSAHSILTKLTAGETKKISITFPEGFTVAQIASRLAANKLFSKEGFLEYLEEVSPKNYDLPGTSFEGLLYPTTINCSARDGFNFQAAARWRVL